MDFKPSVSVLFGHYSLLRRRILIKLGQCSIVAFQLGVGMKILGQHFDAR